MTIIIFIILSFLGLDNSNKSTVSIEFENFKGDYVGKDIYIGYWLSSNQDFPKENKTDFAQIVKADSENPTISKELQNGEAYAISIFIDLNGNGKMDTNFFGKPKEPYCFSNNYKPVFSAPDFEDCSFNLEKDTTLKIKIIN